jgi:hypothetical protein
MGFPPGVVCALFSFIDIAARRFVKILKLREALRAGRMKKVAKVREMLYFHGDPKPVEAQCKDFWCEDFC